MTPSTSYDVVVIGGGHNGLVCAAYLARAGKGVVVLEAQPRVGGFVASEDMAPDGAPGFVMSPYALDHFLTCVPPSVIDELKLSRYGLKMVDIDPWMSWAGPDGASIALWRDRARTKAEIARFSRRDAERFDKLCDLTKTFWEVAIPYFQGHPTRLSPPTVARMLSAAVKGRRSLAPLARIALAPAEAVLNEWFERDELKALLGTLALSVMSPLHQPATAMFVGAQSAVEKWGYRRALGGAGTFAEALDRAARDLGVEVRSGAPVREVLVRDGRAVGAVLDNGETVLGAQVAAAVDPTTLLTKLLDPSLVPDQVTDELRGMFVARHNLCGAFTGHLALSSRPRLRGGRTDELMGGATIFAPDFGYVQRASEAWVRGELTAEIPMFVVVPSILDRSIVPPGSEGDYCYIWPAATPHDLNGLNWAYEKDKWLEDCLNIVEDHAPGIQDTVIAKRAISPAEMGAHVHKSFFYHADLIPTQMGPWRPIPSLSGYRSPVDGLWHTGAGAHPFGLQSGMPGRTTARTILRHAGGTERLPALLRSRFGVPRR